jgi:hypothetical protein
VTEVRTDRAGEAVVEAPRYRLVVSADGLRATLTAPDGEPWATLRPLVACDRVDARDETVAVEPPRLREDGVIEVGRRSTIWKRASTSILCDDTGVELRSSVTGAGAIAEVRLLAARALLASGPTGLLPSGSSSRTLFTPAPGDPGRILLSASENAVIGAAGDSQPGRGHWFFTPAPLYLALTRAEGLTDPEPCDEGWLGIGLAAPVDELRFVRLVYEGGDRAFALRLEYEGHTRVEGTFELPPVLVTPETPDPYSGLALHREQLDSRGAAPRVARRATADWWHEPLFCGWGAQCHLAAVEGGRPSDFAAQARYDGFLAHLAERGVVPGTVVIDDKWQAAYGTGEPDTSKWPDLRSWIGDRHARGQRVLLWWRAWSAEGAPTDLCVRHPDGDGLVLDPDNPATRAFLHDVVSTMLSPDGLDADGLKVDFTASTPSGAALEHRGPRWGIALLHALLATVYDAAKAAKPDALVITHCPHPAFVDVTDMIRLNDMLRLEDPAPRPPVLPQMRYRAAVTRASCPELLIDTDDWCVPDLATWRAYLREKPFLGVPALYYVSHLDATNEMLMDDDYAALAESWAAYREARR